MPELPEVETIRRDLAALLKSRVVSSVQIADERVLQGFLPSGAPRRQVNAHGFSKTLTGGRFTNVLRRGKYLIFEMEEGPSLLSHLRMTGQWIVGDPQPHARARIFLEDKTAIALSFCDTRRFGELWLADDWRKDASIQALGPEPWEESVDAAAWGQALRGSGAKIQAALLDQRRMAGLGNIYVTEALFLSGLRPTRRCRTLRHTHVAPLVSNIRRVLEQGLRHRGVSFYSYRDARGEKGVALQHLFVYGRAGEPCLTCRTILKAVKVSGRGTVYCPKCQK